MTKYAVITGASRGIGYAVAECFTEQGYQIINLARSECPAPGAITIQTDLAERGFEEALGPRLEAVIPEPAPIVLVHNAGKAANDRVDQLPPDDFREMLEINVVAPTILNQLLLPRMTAGSSIIYIGSTRGLRAVAGSFGYVTSKHATIGMMRATCQDLMGRGIHTSCVCPGYTDTEMLRAYVAGDPARKRAMEQLTAENRLIDPKEIARLVHFAATNPVLNGEVITANLGERENTLVFDALG